MLNFAFILNFYLLLYQHAIGFCLGEIDQSKMSTAAQEWLRQQLKGLESVKSCMRPLDFDSDLIVRTWVGMRVNIYFLNEIPSVRVMRRILHENSRNYQGTLFLLHQRLLPVDRTRLAPENGLRALHELNSERIYTFNPSQSRLGQVHFEYMPDGIEREAWYGEDVVIGELRILNVTVSTQGIRGQWMMADFGQNPYWVNSEYRAERLKARFNTTPFGKYGQFTWDRFDVGGNPGGADRDSLRQAYESELDRSYAVLEIATTATPEEAKAAFRRLARLFHPDTSTLEKTEAEERFRQLNKAYDYIKHKKGWS